MHLPKRKLCTRKMELALEVKFYLDFHRVTRPWRRTLTNGSDVKYVFPRCLCTLIDNGNDVIKCSKLQVEGRVIGSCFTLQLCVLSLPPNSLMIWLQ